MPLTSALQLGRSALAASQAAIQVTGNNVANAATPGYSRQVTTLVPSSDTRDGTIFLGRGVEVQSVRRQVNQALQSRLWSGVSRESGASTDLRLLSGLESTINELSDVDLSSQLGAFFNSWSDLANSPNQSGTRSLVIQQGRQLASYLRTLRANLTETRVSIDRELQAQTNRANDLLSQVASINQSIVISEQGQGNANALRDQRDTIITELAQYMDVTTVEQANGMMDVLVGSSPVVLGMQSRGVEFLQQNVNGTVTASVITSDNEETLTITTGSIGSLLTQRQGAVNDVIDRVDTMARQLIYQVNRAHSVGYGTANLTSIDGTLEVRTGDELLAMNDPTNQTFAAMGGLGIAPTTGSFTVTVTNIATGSAQSVRIDVDLDGITSALIPGYADDTSVDDIRAAIGGISNLTASYSPEGQLRINAGSGYRVSFSDDTSGVLAGLGVNTYFTGTDASDIGVRDELVANPGLLASGQVTGTTPSDNGAALAIAALRTQPLATLGGVSLAEHWDQAVQNIAVATAQAKTDSDATRVVRESLDAQKSAISGVSVDEEAINMLTYQRQYQASARFISVVDELTQTLLSMV